MLFLNEMPELKLNTLLFAGFLKNLEFDNLDKKNVEFEIL